MPVCRCSGQVRSWHERHYVFRNLADLVRRDHISRELGSHAGGVGRTRVEDRYDRTGGIQIVAEVARTHGQRRNRQQRSRLGALAEKQILTKEEERLVAAVVY